MARFSLSQLVFWSAGSPILRRRDLILTRLWVWVLLRSSLVGDLAAAVVRYSICGPH